MIDCVTIQVIQMLKVMTMVMIIIIIIRDNIQRTCVSIDATISGDRNVIKKQSAMILRYTDFTAEIQRVWNVKLKVIPVIVGRLEPFQYHSDST